MNDEAAKQNARILQQMTGVPMKSGNLPEGLSPQTIKPLSDDECSAADSTPVPQEAERGIRLVWSAPSRVYRRGEQLLATPGTHIV